MNGKEVEWTLGFALSEIKFPRLDETSARPSNVDAQIIAETTQLRFHENTPTADIVVDEAEADQEENFSELLHHETEQQAEPAIEIFSSHENPIEILIETPIEETKQQTSSPTSVIREVTLGESKKVLKKIDQTILASKQSIQVLVQEISKSLRRITRNLVQSLQSLEQGFLTLFKSVGDSLSRFYGRIFPKIKDKQ